MLASTDVALAQVLAFAAVPFAVFLVTRRRVSGFVRYVGLYRPQARTLWLAVVSAAVISAVTLTILSLPGLREMAPLRRRSPANCGRWDGPPRQR